MRLTDPRLLTTVVLAFMLTGAFAFAVYTASLDGSVFQAPTIKADTFYVGVQTLAQYIAATAPGTTMLTQASPYTYIVSIVGGTYYANSTTGGIDYSDAHFHDLLNNLSGSVYLKAGAYTLSDQVELTSGLRLKGDGPGNTVITCTMATTDVGIFYTDSTTPFATHVHLAANCVTGATAATLTTAVTFLADDWIKIGSTTYFDSGYAAGGAIGEIIQIESVATPVINFDRGVIDTYNTADTAVVSKITFVENIGFEGITFIGPGNSVDNTLIWAYALKGVTIRDCSFQEFGVDCLRFLDCLDVTIDNCAFESVYMSNEGYAVAFLMASDNCNVLNSVFREFGRHSIVLSTGGSYAQPELDCGGPRNVHVTACQFESITGGTGEAINTHHGVYGPLVVTGCTFLNCDNVAQIVNCETTFTGNTFRNCGANGLHFRNNIGTQNLRPIIVTGNTFINTDLRASQSNEQITGNYFYGDSMVLVEAGTSGANPDVWSINIVSNTFQDITSSGAVYIIGTAGHPMTYVNVASNQFMDGSSRNVYAAYSDFLTVSDNVSHGCGSDFVYLNGANFVDNVIVKGNMVDDITGYMVEVIGAMNVTVAENWLSHSSARGVSLVSATTGSTLILITDNQFKTAGAVVYNDASYSNVVAKNNVWNGVWDDSGY
jgi:hypothetical protein